jgi:hypothetical protein
VRERLHKSIQTMEYALIAEVNGLNPIVPVWSSNS